MSRSLAGRARAALRMVEPRALRLGRWRCPACGCGLHLRLAESDIGVRCLRCGASAIAQSLVDAIARACPRLDTLDAYELSSRGTVVDWLAPRVASLATSEYFDDLASGQHRDGVRSEDVQALSFADDSFDLCTSAEVFEHVADDLCGFRELRRVLRPGGTLVFTVPMTGAAETVLRARLVDGAWEHLLPPEWHADPNRGHAPALCVRDYGRDIVARVRAGGFDEVRLLAPSASMFGFAREVVVAR